MTATNQQNLSRVNVPGLNRIILELYRTGRDTACRQFQPAALELIREIIPFDSAWWGNAAAEPMEIHQLYLCNCDASILETYTPYIEQDFFRAALMAQPGVTINMSDLITHQRWRRTVLYRDVGRHYKVEYSLGTLLLEPLSLLQEFLTLWRHDAKKPFSETERQTKELLMPHLAEANRTARLRQVLGEARDRHHCWAVADERGFLREVNAGFVHRLREQWPGWQGNRLPEALLECVRLATPFNTTRLKLKITAKGAFRYMQALALSRMDTLTPREREIVTRYAQGETYAGIAAALALSPSTVRNHLANGYRKLAVNNKAELVLRVSQAERNL